jgi:hypothetical protein
MLQIPSDAPVTDWRRRDTEVNEVTLKDGYGHVHTVYLPFPRAAALFLNQSRLAHERALALRQQLLDTPPPDGVALTSRAYEYLEQLMVSALLAETSIEAFTNTAIPEDYEHVVPTNEKTPTGRHTKEYIEEHYCLDDKLKKVLPRALHKDTPTKNPKLWQAYKKLKKLRNESIVHSKSDARLDGTMWRELLQPMPKDSPKIAYEMIRWFVDAKADHWVNRCPFWQEKD